jgi:L-asparaginase
MGRRLVPGDSPPTTFRGRTVLIIVLLAFAILASARPAATPPRVRLIATGGTIANHPTGRLSAQALIATAPAALQIADVEPETFSRGPSLALTLQEWLRLSRRINDLLAGDSGLAGIVVTSGTDTLEELAWFLDLTVRSDRTVVVTGAMRKPGTPNADGPRNLLDAVRVASDTASRRRGTVVVFHETIFAAREVEKRSTADPDAFHARAHAPLGSVADDGVRFVREASGRHGLTSEFDVRRFAALPRVDVLLTYQAAPGDLVDASLAGGARGLVMAAAGAGALAETESGAIERALQRGATVVLASRVEEGQVKPEDLGPMPGLVAAGDLSPLKARVLLMLALAQGLSGDEIGRVFREY